MGKADADNDIKVLEYSLDILKDNDAMKKRIQWVTKLKILIVYTCSKSL